MDSHRAPDPPEFDLTGLGAPGPAPPSGAGASPVAPEVPPPQDPLPPAAPPGAWPPAARRAVGCGTGCALLVALQAMLIWTGFGALVTVQRDIGAEVRAPARAVVARSFPLVVTIRNRGRAPLRLQGVSAGPETLRAFRLDELRPAPSGSMREVMGRRVWPYAVPLPPGEDWTLRLRAAPRRAGMLRGELELLAGPVPRGVSFRVRAGAAP